MTWLRTAARAAGLLLGAATLALVTFVIGVRIRNPVVLRFARVVQRDLMNPGALRNAGGSDSPWAVIRVPGRRTGRVYDTPAGVRRVGDDLYVSLPYGQGTQWLQNVLAAGGPTVLLDGAEISATDPEVVPIALTPIADTDRAAIAVFGVTHALRLRAAAQGPAPAP